MRKNRLLPGPAWVAGGYLEITLEETCLLYKELGLFTAGRMITGIDGESYQFPDPNAVIGRFREGWEDRYLPKVKEGFDTLLIVPGIAGQKALFDCLIEVMLGREALYSRHGKLALNRGDVAYDRWRDYPMLHWNGLAFVPRADFYASKPFPGYDLLLARSEDRTLPAEGWTASDRLRPGPEAGRRPGYYRRYFGVGSDDGEDVMTTDAGLTYHLWSIATEGMVPDSSSDERDCNSIWCPGSRLQSSSSQNCPCITWWDNHLDLSIESEERPKARRSARSVVRIV